MTENRRSIGVRPTWPVTVPAAEGLKAGPFPSVAKDRCEMVFHEPSHRQLDGRQAHLAPARPHAVPSFRGRHRRLGSKELFDDRCPPPEVLVTGLAQTGDGLGRVGLCSGQYPRAFLPSDRGAERPHVTQDRSPPPSRFRIGEVPSARTPTPVSAPTGTPTRVPAARPASTAPTAASGLVIAPATAADNTATTAALAASRARGVSGAAAATRSTPPHARAPAERIPPSRSSRVTNPAKTREQPTASAPPAPPSRRGMGEAPEHGYTLGASTRAARPSRRTASER